MLHSECLTHDEQPSPWIEMHSHSELLWQGDLQRLSTQLNPHSVTYLSVLSSRWCHVSQYSALSSASMAKCSTCHFLVDPSEHLHPIHTLPHPSTAYISQTTTTNRRSATCDNHHATSPHHSMSFCQQHALLLCHSNLERTATSHSHYKLVLPSQQYGCILRKQK